MSRKNVYNDYSDEGEIEFILKTLEMKIKTLESAS